MLEAQGLVLSTLDLNNQDFLDNNMLFQKLFERRALVCSYPMKATSISMMEAL